MTPDRKLELLKEWLFWKIDRMVDDHLDMCRVMFFLNEYGMIICRSDHYYEPIPTFNQYLNTSIQ